MCSKDCPRGYFTRSQLRKRGKRARCKSCTAALSADASQKSEQNRAQTIFPSKPVVEPDAASIPPHPKSSDPTGCITDVKKVNLAESAPRGSDENDVDGRLKESGEGGGEAASVRVNMAVKVEVMKAEPRVPSPTSVAEHPAVRPRRSPRVTAAGKDDAEAECDIYGRKCAGLLLRLYRSEKKTEEDAREAVVDFLTEYEGREKELWHKLQAYDEKLKLDRSKLGLRRITNSDAASMVKAGKKRKRERSGHSGNSSEASSDSNCDRCDGAHESFTCPYYKKPRGKHPDEQRRKGLGLAGCGGNYFVPFSRARVRHQPGDGSCLFHSMCFGLRRKCRSAYSLRRELGEFE